MANTINTVIKTTYTFSISKELCYLISLIALITLLATILPHILKFTIELIDLKNRKQFKINEEEKKNLQTETAYKLRIDKLENEVALKNKQEETLKFILSNTDEESEKKLILKKLEKLYKL